MRLCLLVIIGLASSNPTAPSRAPTLSPSTPVCPYVDMTLPSSVEVEDCTGKLDFRSALTMSVWLRVPISPRSKPIFFARHVLSDSPWFGLVVAGANATAFLANTTDGEPPAGSFTFVSSWPNNTWVHIVLTWTSSSKNITAYRDGIRLGTLPQPGQLRGDERITIGKNFSYGASGFGGLMNQFTLYSRELILDEVGALYRPAMAFPPLTSLMLLLFEQYDAFTDSGILVDVSHYGHSLILSNIVVENSPIVTLCNAPAFCGNNTPCARGLPCVGGVACSPGGACVQTNASTQCLCAPPYTGLACDSVVAGVCDPVTTEMDSYANFGGLSSFELRICPLSLAQSDMTVSFWARPWQLPVMGYNPVVSTGDLQDQAMYIAFVPTGVEFGWGPSASNRVTFDYQCVTNQIAPQEWQLVIARYTQATQEMELFVDGSRRSKIANSPPFSTLGSMYIGILKNSADISRYEGALDEFRIHTRLLRSSEMSGLLVGAPPLLSGLLVYLPFNVNFNDASLHRWPFAQASLPPLDSTSPVCRPINACTNQCTGGLCGAQNGTAVCSCYNSQHEYLSLPDGTCGVSDGDSTCDAGTQPLDTAGFSSGAHCIHLRACAIRLDGNFSLEMWLRTNSTGESTVFSQVYPIPLTLKLQGKLLSFQRGNENVWFNCALTAEWHHVVAVGTYVDLTLYVDGILVNSTASNISTTQDGDGDSRLYLGCAMSEGGPYLPFIGRLSQVHAYTRALPPADVSAHFRNVYTDANTKSMVLDLLLAADVLDRAHVFRSQLTHFINVSGTPIFGAPTLCMDQSQAPCNVGNLCGPNGDCRPGLSAGSYVCKCKFGTSGPQCDSIGCAGDVGPYADFDGFSTLTVNGFDLSLFAQNFTISMWIRPDSRLVGPAGLFGHADRNGTNGGLGLGISAEGDIVFGLSGVGTTASLPCSSGGVWHSVTGVVAGGSIYLVLDGVFASQKMSFPLIAPSTDNTLLLGAWMLNGTLQYFLGQMDEVRLFSQGLSPGQINLLHLSNLVGVSPSLHLSMSNYTDSSVNNYTIIPSPLDSLLPNTGSPICFNPTPAPTLFPTPPTHGPTQNPTTGSPSTSTPSQSPTRAPTTQTPVTAAPTYISTTSIISFFGSQLSADTLSPISNPLAVNGETEATVIVPAFFEVVLNCSLGSRFRCANNGSLAVESFNVLDLQNVALKHLGGRSQTLSLASRTFGQIIIPNPGFILPGNFVLNLTQNPVCPPAFWACNTGKVFCCTCPVGALCVDGITTTAADGFIKFSNSFFLQCTPATACAKNKCVAPAYTNQMHACDTCTEGYFRRNQVCIPCPNTAVLVLIIGVILFLLALLVILRVSVVSDTKTFSFTISLGFVQLISIFATLPFSWPATTNVMFDVLSFANFNVDLFSPECAVTSSYWSRWVLKLMLPVIATGVLLFIYMAVKKFPRARDIYYQFLFYDPVQKFSSGANKPDLAKAREIAEQWETNNLPCRFVAAMTQTSSVLYTFLCKISLDPLNCAEQTDGTPYLRADPSVRCYDSTWNSMAVLFTLAIIFYVVAIPVFLFGVLFRAHRKNQLDSPYIHFRYGILIIPYRTQFWYWEGVQMMRKLSAVILVNFGAASYGQASTAQINGMVLVLLLFLGAQEFTNPYQVAWCNRVTFAWTITCILVLGAALLFENKVLSPSQEEGYAAGLIVACIGSFFVSVICYFRERQRARDLVSLAPGSTRLDREKEERRVLVETFGPDTGLALFRKARGLSAKNRSTFIEKLSLGTAGARLAEIELADERNQASESKQQFVERFGELGDFLYRAVEPNSRAEFLAVVAQPLLSAPSDPDERL